MYNGFLWNTSNWTNFKMPFTEGGKSWFHMFALLVLVLFLSGYGCSSKTQVHDVGENATLFEPGISIYTELNEENLLLRVDNLYGIDYRLWITYSYDCLKKKGSNRTEVYHGNEKEKSILIDIPKKEKSCTQRIGAKILDFKGKSIYSTPTLNIFQIGELHESK